ncbi:MAG: DUF6152 family protein [Acidobacteriota bacterium]
MAATPAIEIAWAVMLNRLTRLLLTVTVVVAVKPALAHHSFAAEFDGTQPVTLRGTVTRIEWANPHGWIYLDVRGSDGTVVSWAVETAAPNALIRRGVRNSDFPVGIEITVKGYRAKNGTAKANASTLTLPDGRELLAGSSGTGAPGDTPDAGPRK